ncbi:plasmid partitioning/stability family protein [Escherichia coli]|uniref:plasmid partitioning/stability family protein n=1 Tax=Escherichia coli TaxID=562 RepID=UPI00207B8E5F|nr:plasmid partitioning/stability family protein [Escherichia coli]
MSDENKSRRCSFELFPDERTGDKIADELIANEKLKERGRFMRAMLVTGAAFAAIDKRLPLLISELLTENTTLDDINKVISSVIPGAFSVEKKLLELLEKQSGLHTSVDCSTPLKPPLNWTNGLVVQPASCSPFLLSVYRCMTT